jgi:hypothetical protein
MRIRVQRLDGKPIADAMFVGVAVGRLDRRGRFRGREALGRKQVPDVDQARTWFELSVPVTLRAEKADSAESVRAFVELVGDVVVFDRESPVRKQLPAARKTQKQRLRGKARFRLLRSTVRA